MLNQQESMQRMLSMEPALFAEMMGTIENQVMALMLRSGRPCASSKAILFDPNFTMVRSGQVVQFDGASFQSWADQNFSFGSSLTPIRWNRSVQKIPRAELLKLGGIWIGNYLLIKQVLPAGEYLSLSDSQHFGRCFFDRDVTISTLFEPGQGSRVWMSITPMEAFTCRAGIEAAVGSVVVGGLGLGWQLEQILKKSSVTHVTCVDLNGDLLGSIGVELQRKYCDRLKLVKGNVWRYLKQHEFDSYIIDIWPEFFQAGRDPKFKALKKRWRSSSKVIWGWGDQQMTADLLNR